MESEPSGANANCMIYNTLYIVTCLGGTCWDAHRSCRQAPYHYPRPQLSQELLPGLENCDTHRWAIAPQYIEHFRIVLYIFQACVPTIQRASVHAGKGVTDTLASVSCRHCGQGMRIGSRGVGGESDRFWRALAPRNTAVTVIS